jgi:hypothetical protein
MQLQHFEAAELGHLDVEEYEVGIMFLYGFETFESIATFGYHLYFGVGLQECFYQLPRQWLIVNEYDFIHAAVFLIVVVKYSSSFFVSSRSVRA